MILRARNFLTRPGLGPQLVKSVIGSAGLRIVGMVFSFLVGVLLTRNLGAAGYGVYGVSMSIIALLSVPVEFGMPQLLVREVSAAEVAGNWGRMRGVLHWASHAALLFSTVISGGVLIWILLTDRSLATPLSMALLAGILMIPFGALGRQRGAALMGLHHIAKGQFPEVIIRPAVFSLLLLLTGYFCASPLTPALAMMLGTFSAATAFTVVTIMFNRIRPDSMRHAKKEFDSRRWWASAIPMAMAEGMRQLQANIATLVMGVLATAAAVGVFRAASSISVIVSIPVTLFILVGSPMISKLHAQGDKERLQRLLGWLSVGMTVGSILLTVPFLIAAGSLLARVFGAEFEASSQPLLILCLGSILYSALGSSVILLNMTGHEKRVTRAFMISIVTLAVVSPPLVHFYGVNGAAWANVIAMLLGNGLMWRDARRLLSLDASLLSFLRRRPN